MKHSLTVLNSLILAFISAHANASNKNQSLLRPRKLSCLGADPISCGCSEGNQADYRGTVAVTEGGIECQRWDQQSPHRHSLTVENYPNAGLVENYCRNPDDEPGGAWCYTVDPGKRWDYCDVPICGDRASPTPGPSTSIPTVSTPRPSTTTPVTSDPTLPPTSAVTPSPSAVYCPVPELSSLEQWATNLRASSQAANLDAVSTECPIDPLQQKILMIGVDGLRADISMLPLDNFRRLQSMGTYSYWANVQSTATALSGPGWSSMFTGVEAATHGVGGNGDLTDISSTTVFKLVKDTFGKKVAASVSWHPLINDIIDHEDSTTLDARYRAQNDDDNTEQVKQWILSKAYDFIFVDLDKCDAAGHGHGFDPYLPEYRQAVYDTDANIGTLIDAVLSVSDGEEWLIVLTSDHGGEGSSHGSYDEYNRRIPFIVASNSPRVNIGVMPLDDPGSQMDVLPTIMHFLGGASAVPTGLDGQVFGFLDYTRKPPPEPASCVPDPLNCGCSDELQADYRGSISTTVSGLTCQRWDSQDPNTHDRTPENYPDSDLDENYCRNPDGEPSAWCYTVNGTRWEICSVPDCPTTADA